jgi:membrane complex biogenesis BtpA family protein
MIHLPPLPGFDNAPDIDTTIHQALADLRCLAAGGVDAVLIENEYDRPHQVQAAAETVAAMTRIVTELVRHKNNLAIGCEILLNDPCASLAVAKMSGADFIRTDYFVDAMLRPEYGIFAIDPDALVEYRSTIAADNILIFADIQVKYATMIEPRSMAESARIACEKHADAVIVTGNASGCAPLTEQLDDALSSIKASGFDMPVLIGSGFDSKNAASLLEHCNGAIVGTAIMRDKIVNADALDLLMAQVRLDAR